MPGCSRWAGLGVALGLAWPALVAPHPGLAQVAPPSDTAATAEPRAAVLNLSQTGVPAEGSAENGVLAREKALAAGRRTAWERLVAEAGTTSPTLSDAQIENLVSSIVIEQERPAPTRYSGRITVNFNPGRVRSTLGSRLPGGAGGGVAGGGTAGEAAPAVAQTPASNWLEVEATYASMAEWLEMLRRLRGSAPVASVDIRGIAVDAARLRVGLRVVAPEAAATLAGSGLALTPVGGALMAGTPVAGTPVAGVPGAAPAVQTWRLGLAGGG